MLHFIWHYLRSLHTKNRIDFSHSLQRTNTENSKQIFPEKELRGQYPNFHIHVSVRDLYIPTIDLPILLQEICGPILGIYKSLTDTWMCMEMGTEAAQFPEKEYINGIFIAVFIWKLVRDLVQKYTYIWEGFLWKGLGHEIELKDFCQKYRK